MVRNIIILYIVVPRIIIFIIIIIINIIILYPPTLPTSVKARCSIEVVSEACGIFRVNFRKNASYRLRRLAQNTGRGIRGVRHFPCKFPHKMPLVTCPCAFRLCRLAQNVGRGIKLASGIFPANFRAECLL